VLPWYGRGQWFDSINRHQIAHGKVNIWSDEHQDWLKDDDGNIIKYDGDNIVDSDIWNDTSRKYEPTALLVLSSK